MSEDSSSKNALIGVGGAVAGALITALVALFLPFNDHRRDDEGRRRELRALACNIHIHFLLPAHIVSSNKNPNQSLIVPRLKASDFEPLKPNDYKNLPQQIVADIGPFRDAALQVAKDEKGKSDFEGLEYVSFVSGDIGDAGNESYRQAGRDIRNLDRVASKLAQDLTSSRYFLEKPNYCDLSAEP